MAISYRPRVGEVLECNFGDLHIDRPYDLNRRIPSEMVKNRMVVVINPKMDGNIIVVPISSKKWPVSIGKGIHIEIPTEMIKVTNFYDKRERWAKCETVQLVSKHRLFKMRDGNEHFDQYLPRELVTEIQKGICISMNARGLLNQ